jgi:hypothetical protein
VLDTDLWVKGGLNLDLSQNLIGYHKEHISDHPRNPYISPTNFLDCRKYDFDWTINPINCGFLYFNSQFLVQLWVSIAEEVVKSSDSNITNGISSDTIFIEQRLLSVIAEKLRLKWTTLIDNVYYPECDVNDEGLEWKPSIGHSDKNKQITSRKKRYHERQIRDLVLDVCLDSLDDNFPNWIEDVPELVEKIWQYQKNGQLSI